MSKSPRDSGSDRGASRLGGFGRGQELGVFVWVGKVRSSALGFGFLVVVFAGTRLPLSSRVA